jgi:hypothetical protein
MAEATRGFVEYKMMKHRPDDGEADSVKSEMMVASSVELTAGKVRLCDLMPHCSFTSIVAVTSLVLALHLGQSCMCIMSNFPLILKWGLTNPGTPP